MEDGGGRIEVGRNCGRMVRGRYEGDRMMVGGRLEGGRREGGQKEEEERKGGGVGLILNL